MQIDIGIDAGKREELAAGLARVLADSYTLYLQTHNFHWNVTGPMFQTLHLMFEAQYGELALAVDLVAERIRALGHPAPATSRRFAQLSSIEEIEGVPKAQDMIRILVSGHEAVARTARQVYGVAERASDQPTCDLLTQRGLGDAGPDTGGVGGSLSPPIASSSGSSCASSCARPACAGPSRRRAAPG
jgi:starvation-inducible DNA-binding protein